MTDAAPGSEPRARRPAGDAMPRALPDRRATLDSTVRRRRLAAVVIAALIIIPTIVLLSRGGSNAPSSADIQKALTDPATALRLLSHRVAIPQEGIEVLYPTGWRGDVVNGAVQVTSNDNRTGFTIVPRGTAAQARSVFQAAVHGISASLQGARATFPKTQPVIAGLPAGEAVVTGTRNGVRLSTLVAVARGARVSYVITVLAPPGGGQLGIANLILARGVTLSG